MSGPRLCQVKDEMREAVNKLPNSESLTKSRFAILECPNGRHCDKSGPCKAMRNPVVTQTLALIQDRLFINGFVRTEK